MKSDEIKNQLVEGGLHEDSVNGMLRHYQKMQFYLKSGEYEAAGVHVGKFCENIANILHDKFFGNPLKSPGVGTIVDKVKHEKDAGEPKIIRVTMTRFLRATYDIRNKRDSAHVNLDISVSHSDTQTAVRMCSWMLSELIRSYGILEDMDDIEEGIEEDIDEEIDKASREIESLASVNYAFIDQYDERRMIASTDLDLGEELLVLLYTSDGDVPAEELERDVPNEDLHAIKSALGALKQSRKIFYEDGRAKIAKAGADEAEKIMERIEVEDNE
ncbi:MAG: hypothetical protein ABEJ95_03405 [Candidatus Nanohalobium sp.]